MKLRQLQYISEVARRGLNVSTVAEILHTAQPGISTQIRLLEEELNVKIFERNGKRLVGVTQPGKRIIEMSERVLREIEDIRQVGGEFSQEDSGTFSIATTHTQTRYVLPQTIKHFKERYPDVRLRIHQGDQVQVAEMVTTGVADIAITSETGQLPHSIVALPCFDWDFIVIAPNNHSILNENPVTLEKIAEHPLITYDYAAAGRSVINKAFTDRNLATKMALTAMDSDVIKTYVELGLGIGVLAKMAYDEVNDPKLKAMDAGHLFEKSTTYIGVQKGKYLRSYMYAFIELFAPHLNKEKVDIETNNHL